MTTPTGQSHQRARAGAPVAQLLLDPTVCEGHGLCAELLPELIGLDEWGYPVLEGGAVAAGVGVPADLLDAAREAATLCPVLALRLNRLG